VSSTAHWSFCPATMSSPSGARAASGSPGRSSRSCSPTARSGSTSTCSPRTYRKIPTCPRSWSATSPLRYGSASRAPSPITGCGARSSPPPPPTVWSIAWGRRSCRGRRRTPARSRRRLRAPTRRRARSSRCAPCGSTSRRWTTRCPPSCSTRPARDLLAAQLAQQRTAGRCRSRGVPRRRARAGRGNCPGAHRGGARAL